MLSVTTTGTHTRDHSHCAHAFNSHMSSSKLLYLLIKDYVERESIAESLQVNVECFRVDWLKAPQ